MVPHPPDWFQAVTAYMYNVGQLGGLHWRYSALIEGYTCPIPWVGYAWVVCASGAPGGHLGCAVRGRAGLDAGGWPVPDQRSVKIKAGDFISSGGPALLNILEPDYMVVPDDRPPKALTIMHEIPEMGSRVFSYGVGLHVHDGHVPLDKSQGAHGLILGWLAFRGVDIFMGPGYSMYSCSISWSELT